MLTKDQVEEYRFKYNLSPENDLTTPPDGNSLTTDLAIGAAKGVGDTVKSAVDFGNTVARTITKPIIGDAANPTAQEQAIGSKIDEALKASNTTQKVGKAAEFVGELASPLIVTKASKLTKLIPKIKELSAPKVVTDIVKDVKPTAAAVRDRFLANSLRLAPVEDISAIEHATGNNIGDFMSRFNLIKDTPEETAAALGKFSKKNYDLTRDAISLVDDRFTLDDVPELKPVMDFLKTDLAKRSSPEYKQALEHLIKIEKQADFELQDVQYVKSLFDDVESVYKKTGDVRDAVQAQDKANTVSHVRRFIEDRVQEVYPDVDIRQLNNNVQTSRAIHDAVIKRSNKADTASLFQLGDMAVLGIGEAQAPGAGYAALFAKKIINSSPILLRLSRYFGSKTVPGKAGNTKQLEEVESLIRTELEKAFKEAPTETAK